MNRGYFGIGIEHAKTEYNIGTLWRSAQIMGAAFIFTINNRYKKQSSDTMKTFRHIPLIHYSNFSDFYCHLPYDCMLIGIELDERAIEINRFEHPERCVYLLGAEDHGLTKEALNSCHSIVQLPGDFCMNVSVAGALAMYDRITKRQELT